MIRLDVKVPHDGEELAGLFSREAKEQVGENAPKMFKEGNYRWAARLYDLAAAAYEEARGVSLGHNRRARYEAAAERLKERAEQCRIEATEIRRRVTCPACQSALGTVPHLDGCTEKHLTMETAWALNDPARVAK
jgi:RNase P subunit RPR2